MGATVSDPAFELEGRRALVTGASTGIGAAIAARLAGAGAAVVGVSRSGRAPDGVAAIAADLAVPQQLESAVDEAVERLSGLDILVNNAGTADFVALADLDRDRFDTMVELNLWAPLRLCQLAHRHLAQSTDAAVVMVGSVDAERPSAGAAVYGATKAGLRAAVVALAKEWAPDGIRVTQVDPGLVDTPLAADTIANLDRAVNIVGRPGTPEEIAGLVHYLVAPAGRFATGTSYRVDGGALALGPYDLA